MTDKRDEALKLALEALNLARAAHGQMLLSDPPQEAWKAWGVSAALTKAMTAASEALAEQPAQQEPVDFASLLREAEELVREKPTWKRFIEGTPLSNDIAVWMTVFAQDVARRTSPPAQQGQVAWTLLLTGEHHGLVGKSGEKFVGAPDYYKRVDVYTSPRRTWVGLTDEEVDEWTPEIHSVIRAIEVKLKDKNT